jgi:UDP-N-acetylglucosamine:LPS N-acetylglucosamine transferase
VELILVADSGPDWPNVHRTGPIVRSPSAPREKLRKELFFRKKTILVTLGGTAIGQFLIDKAIEAFSELKLDDASIIVVSGPKLKVDPVRGVYSFGFLPNLQDFVSAADLVVTTAGKGTMHEVLAYGIPVIAILPKGHAEAERNARTLCDRFEDTYRLKELIPQRLALGWLPPEPTGNVHAVDLLADFLDRATNDSRKRTSQSAAR